MDPISSAAVGALQNMDFVQLIIALAVGVALAPVNQALIEHNLANQSWVPAGMKSMLPMLISAGLGKLAVALGVDPGQAVLAVTTLAGATHVVNETNLAAVSKEPEPKKDLQ